MAKAPAKPTKRVARRVAPAAAPSRIDLGQQLGASIAPMPGFIEPALATLVAKPPSGEMWVHEVKFDGYRVQARVDAGRVTLLTRSGLDWTERFGERLPEALRMLPLDQAIIDGELVVQDGEGRSDFGLLQGALKDGRTGALLYYAFDLLYLDGRDLRSVTLGRRRELLQLLLAGARDPVRFSEHFTDPGDAVLRHACALRLEGIISKSLNHPYRSGRAGLWFKEKCSSRQEFVIAGYLPATGSTTAVGSLVLGAYEGEKLRHLGRVGTGFTNKVAQDLFRRLEPLRIDQHPFAGKITSATSRGARFVRPELVAEVEFRGWSSDGLLRHASYRGLREDKVATEVRLERHQPPPAGI